jgi:hypothetical protein
MTAAAPPQDLSHAYALLTWLPFAFVLAGAIVFWKRARRDAPVLESRGAEEVPQRDEASPAV